MTQGQLITRLCRIRDDLTDTVVQLKDAPTEWVKEEPEGCEHCIEELSFAVDECGDLIRIVQMSNGEYDIIGYGMKWSFPIDFCPFCGRDLR